MVSLRLALRNILGAGLRTWLNVIVLSFSFVVIIWHKGLLDGWDRQAIHDMIEWEIAGGQYWVNEYDPYDPFSISESHAPMPEELDALIRQGEITPLLYTMGTIYPNGRMQSILIKGIEPGQEIIAVPSNLLQSGPDEIPAIIGTGMASSTGLKEGSFVTLRWRDKNGAFDAAQVKITGIFKTNVPSVDASQIWLPIDKLRDMMLLPDEATILICRDEELGTYSTSRWDFKEQDELMVDLKQIIRSKSMAGLFIWAILLMVAMLAIFDTQVLSIFRRQREIGTYVALGMTRRQVVTLFTFEGAMHAVFATVLGAAYGLPLLAMQAKRGINLPVSSEDYGLTMAEKLYPVYSLGLILGTVIVVVIVTTLVSYWPSRKIARMNPTEALRGRWQ
ncbi:MAG: ABC transporter permease [Bacteroidia bacterium]|nr:MAG: ABC transporter permease [Bacteroidia bacterium]